MLGVGPRAEFMWQVWGGRALCWGSDLRRSSYGWIVGVWVDGEGSVVPRTEQVCMAGSTGALMRLLGSAS